MDSKKQSRPVPGPRKAGADAVGTESHEPPRALPAPTRPFIIRKVTAKTPRTTTAGVANQGSSLRRRGHDVEPSATMSSDLTNHWPPHKPYLSHLSQESHDNQTQEPYSHLMQHHQKATEDRKTFGKLVEPTKLEAMEEVEHLASDHLSQCLQASISGSRTKSPTFETAKAEVTSNQYLSSVRTQPVSKLFDSLRTSSIVTEQYPRLPLCSQSPASTLNRLNMVCSAISDFFSIIWPIITWSLSFMRPFMITLVVICLLYIICAQVYNSTIAPWLAWSWHASKAMVDPVTTTFQSAFTKSKAFVCVIPMLHGVCAQLQNPVALYHEHISPTITVLTNDQQETLTTVESLRAFTASLSSIYVILPPAECKPLTRFMHDSSTLQDLFNAYTTQNLLLLDDIGFRSSFLVDDLQKLIDSPTDTYKAVALSLLGYQDHTSLSQSSLLATLQSWSENLNRLSGQAQNITKQWKVYRDSLNLLLFDLKARRDQQSVGWWLNLSKYAVTLHQTAILRDFLYLDQRIEIIQEHGTSVLTEMGSDLSAVISNLVNANATIPQVKSHLLIALERRNASFQAELNDLRAKVASIQLSKQDRNLFEHSVESKVVAPRAVLQT